MASVTTATATTNPTTFPYEGMEAETSPSDTPRHRLTRRCPLWELERMSYSRDICAPLADELIEHLAEACETKPLPADAGESVGGKTFLGACRRWVRSNHRGQPVMLAVTVQLFQEQQ